VVAPPVDCQYNSCAVGIYLPLVVIASAYEGAYQNIEIGKRSETEKEEERRDNREEKDRIRERGRERR
jgi:hypothetical protein